MSVERRTIACLSLLYFSSRKKSTACAHAYNEGMSGDILKRAQSHTLREVHGCHDSKPKDISHRAADLKFLCLLVRLGGIVCSSSIEMASIGVVTGEWEVPAPFDHAIEERLRRFLVHRDPIGAEFFIDAHRSLVETFGSVFQEVKVVLAESLWLASSCGEFRGFN